MSQVSSEEMPADASGHVLVVEDDPWLREALCEALSLEGHVAVGVEHGEAALRHLTPGRRPALILLDMMMPVMDGWTFRREILKNEELARIPVVLMTAALPSRTRDVLSEAVLEKPLRIEAVIQLVQNYCTASQRAS